MRMIFYSKVVVDDVESDDVIAELDIPNAAGVFRVLHVAGFGGLDGLVRSYFSSALDQTVLFCGIKRVKTRCSRAHSGVILSWLEIGIYRRRSNGDYGKKLQLKFVNKLLNL